MAEETREGPGATSVTPAGAGRIGAGSPGPSDAAPGPGPASRPEAPSEVPAGSPSGAPAGGPADGPSDRPADRASVWALARRDGAIALAALALFAGSDAWRLGTGLPLASALSLAVAVAVGIALGTRAHEWGHFAGARLFGGIAPTRELSSLFPIFDFDLVRSPERAFRAMSVGGNLGHWGLVLALGLLLPLDAPARVALFASAFGFALSASLTEFPIIGRSWQGASPVESFRGLTGGKLRRNERIGLAAGVVLFLLLV